MNHRSRSRAAVQPRLRARLRELTADVILEAAERAFAEQGPAAGMDAIATRAGVAVGTLYNHFQDRDSLVDALLEARSTVLLDRMQRAIAESQGQALRARLVYVLEAVVAHTSPNARFRQVFLQAELRRPRKRAIVERMRAALSPLFEQGQHDGQLRSDPDGLQAAFLLGLLHTALVASFDAPELLPRERIAALVVDQFLDGVRVHGA